MNADDELLKNLDKLHTTELGVERIKRNLFLDTDDEAELKIADDSLTQTDDTPAEVTRTTPSCGARHGLTLPTTFWRETEARSVSTTAATPSAALTKYRPSIWA